MRQYVTLAHYDPETLVETAAASYDSETGRELAPRRMTAKAAGGLQEYPRPFSSPGTAVLAEGVETETFRQYNGFALLSMETIGGVDTVVAYEPLVEEWEQWRASLPEPGPEPEAEVTTGEMAAAIVEGVNEV